MMRRETLANGLMMSAMVCAIALPLAIADPKPVDSTKADATESKTGTSTSGDGEPSIDDLLKLSNPNKTGKAKDADAKTKPDDGKLDGLSPGQVTDAFVAAVTEMKMAAARLGGYQDPGLKTQRLQESILRRLDQVIEAKKKQNQQQSQSSSGSGSKKQETGSKKNQPKKGQGQKSKGGSSANKGQVSPGDNDLKATLNGSIDETRIEWGQLPSRLRNELDQGLGEKFSPLYKKLTEAYYKRLAEEGKE